MAHKRILIYALLVAICYLVGVTWAENALQGSSNVTSINGEHGTAPMPAVAKVQPAASPAATPIAKVAAAQSANTSTPAKPDCVCDGALLPRLDENGNELPICAECKCKHLARNTTLIKVVVIIVIWIISILVIYMLFLMCLDPLLNKRVKANYQEHTNEDDEPTPPMPNTGVNQELNSRANVLNRVGHQQDKWKRQVREQRRHIYDRHTMLN